MVYFMVEQDLIGLTRGGMKPLMHMMAKETSDNSITNLLLFCVCKMSIMQTSVYTNCDELKCDYPLKLVIFSVKSILKR